MNLKVKLNKGDEFIGHGKNKEILSKVIEGLKNGTIKVPIAVDNYKPQYVCFRLNESELDELYDISVKTKLTLAELLRGSLEQLNLITHTKK